VVNKRSIKCTVITTIKDEFQHLALPHSRHMLGLLPKHCGVYIFDCGGNQQTHVFYDRISIGFYRVTARYCQGLSVRLSVKNVYCDKMKETCAHILILILHERQFILVF